MVAVRLPTIRWSVRHVTRFGTSEAGETGTSEHRARDCRDDPTALHDSLCHGLRTALAPGGVFAYVPGNPLVRER